MRRMRAGALGFSAMEFVVAVALLSTLVPQDKVLCRADGGHEALESVLAACCGGAEAGTGCGSPLLAALGATAGGEECTDLAVPQPSLRARPHSVLPGGLLPASQLDASARGADRSAAIPASGAVLAPTLACVQATTLLI